MKTTIPIYPIVDYPSAQDDSYKLKVIKSPEAMITFRKSFISENPALGSRIYFAVDELNRNYVVKEYRLTGSKHFKRKLGWFSSSALSAKRDETVKNIEADFQRVEALGRAFGPRGFCLNKSNPQNSTKCYAFQRLLKDNLPNLLPGMLRAVPSQFDVAHFVAMDIARDVALLHEQHCIHLDIKPDNVCLHQNYFQLIDFDCSGTGELVKVRASTAEYAPPEQDFGGLVNKSADIFALGVLFFELVQPPGARLLGWQEFSHQGLTVATELVLTQYSEYRLGLFNNIGVLTRDHFRAFDAVLDSSSAAYARLVRSMLELTPEKRPSIEGVICALEALPIERPECVSTLRTYLANVPERSALFQTERKRLTLDINHTKSLYSDTFWRRR